MDKYRLLTKSDFDGVLCAALLKAAGVIADIVFVNSFDFEGGKVAVSDKDITCNLPYSNKVKLAFSYQKEKQSDKHIVSDDVQSCSEIIYHHYKENFTSINDKIIKDLLKAVAKSNAAAFTKEEILNPKGFDMLNFLLDSRTGIGRVRAFRISNYALMISLVDQILNKDINQILAMPDIKERIDYYLESSEDYEEMLEYCAKQVGDVLVVDVRNEAYVKPANRFIKFAMFPESKFAIQIMWGLRKMNTVFAVGKSIFNKNEELDLEAVLKQYGGISRRNSGSVQVKSDEADKVLKQIIAELSSK